jgi:branched-chain amino acid transport system substrate-binding protein
MRAARPQPPRRLRSTRALTCGLIAAVLAGSLLAAGPARVLAADATHGAPYEIDAILPMTGPGAFLGTGFVQALRAVELVTNRTGGIAGRPVKFVIADSASSPATSLQLVNALIAKQTPVFIDGGPSAVCNSAVAIVQANGPVDYCLSSAIYPQPNSYAFSTGVAVPVFSDILVRYLRLRGWTRLALITSTDATGNDFDQQIGRTLQLHENGAVKLVAHEHFNVGDLSVAAQMAHIKAADPQVVMTWSTGTPFGTILHGMQDAGLKLPVTAVPSNQNFTELAQYAALLPPELYFPSARAVTQTGTGAGPVRDAQLIYYGAFKTLGTRPDFVSNLAWDPAMILVSALRAVGPSATAAQLHDYLIHLHSYAGVNGIYDFRDGSQRGIGSGAANIQRWDPKRSDFIAVSKPGGYPL